MPGARSRAVSLEPLEESNEPETTAALEEVKAHLLKNQHPTSFLTRPRVRKLSKFDRDHLRTRAQEDETVSDDFFGEQHKTVGTVRLRISRAQEGVEGGIRWLGSVVGSAGRNSGESNRSMRRKKSVHQVVKGEQAALEELEMSMGTKVYSHLSLLGIQNSRTSSSSSLSSELSTSLPTPDVSIPGTPAPSLALSPITTSNKTFPQPFSPRTNLSPPPAQTFNASSTTSLNSSPHVDPPSRTLTLDNAVAVARRDSKLSFSPSHHKKLSIRPREFQRMLAKRRKKADGKLGLLAGDADDDEILAKALMEIGVAVEEKEKFVLEILYENQRGAMVFGLPKFSANVLNQFDPPPWVDDHLKPTPFTPNTFPLPTTFWTWTYSEWLIDMNDDVDEQGWSYAIRFQSAHWRGQPEAWRSFVRRRRWIRGRLYQPQNILYKALNPATTTDARSNVIDWEALRQEYSSSTTSSNALESAASSTDSGYRSATTYAFDEVEGLEKATALLPLSPERKDDIFGWEQGIDVRDPFLAFSFVKIEGESILARRRAREVEGKRSDEALWKVWKYSVVEINFRRIGRVMKSCRLDREKLRLWNYWFGLKVEGMMIDEVTQEEEDGEEEKRTDGEEFTKLGRRHVELLGLSAGAEGGKRRASWGKRPSLDDVWDLVEFRLDPILSFFEFQNSRLALLHLLLSLHPQSHANHKYNSYDRGHPFEPKVLSPRVDVAERLAPRIGFYDDLVRLEREFYFKAEAEAGWKGKERERE